LEEERQARVEEERRRDEERLKLEAEIVARKRAEEKQNISEA
jgi:hypothetical protein